MTTYGAYNAGLPCKNTACKSHGKPHPNCQCYGADMAEGGEVKSYCSSSHSHKKECEYYSPGIGDRDGHDAISSYVVHEGIHGLLGMRKHNPDLAMGKYDRSVKNGDKKFQAHVDELFGGKALPIENHDDSMKAIDEWIEKGGHTHELQEELYKLNAPKEFSEGGDVKADHEKGIHGHPIEREYPHHAAALSAVKGRASVYLQSLKPQKHQAKLAFDDAPDQKPQEKSYKRALGIAAHPLSILQKIKKGTIEPEHIQQFNALHPEMNETLQNKLTEQITKMQLSGEKPNYKIRQGLSMLLGTPLSGEMTPANIQAAQSVFQKQPSQPQTGSGSAPAKKTNAISKSSQAYLLPDQASASRQQKQ